MTETTSPSEQPSSPYGKLYVSGLAICGLLMLAFILMKFIAPDLLPGHVEMAAFFLPLGGMLMISGIALLDVNRHKTEDFVSSAPYAGKVSGLTRGQALFFNWLLLLMGLAIIVAGITIYLIGPLR